MARMARAFELIKVNLLRQKSVYSYKNGVCSLSSKTFQKELPPNITFSPAVIKISSDQTSDHQKRPPLVLCFGWMFAKDSHLEKSRNFWTTLGYDVFLVKTDYKALVFPYRKVTGTADYTKKLVKYLSSMEKPYEKIIFHNFSIGTYVSSILRVQLNREIEKNKVNILKVRFR